MFRFAEPLRDPPVTLPVTVRLKLPIEVAPVVMSNGVVVEEAVLCGKLMDDASVVVASPGAPLKLNAKLLGRPVVVEPETRLALTV